MIAVAVIVIAAVTYLGFQKRSTAAAQASTSISTSRPVAPAASAPGVAAGRHVETVATAGFATPKAVGSETPDLNMELSATGLCWIAATTDGELRVQRLMNAGDRQTITARESLAIRVGDPAAITFSLNGAPGRSLGEAGRPVSVTITPQNYRDYLTR
jgi:cytoskeletal protein RodZ